MADDEKDEEQQVTETNDAQVIGGCKRAEEGKVLETVRKFYFHGDNFITVENVVEIAVTELVIRVVDVNGHVFTAYFAHLLGTHVELPDYETPFVGKRIPASTEA